MYAILTLVEVLQIMWLYFMVSNIVLMLIGECKVRRKKEKKIDLEDNGKKSIKFYIVILHEQ